MEPVMADNLPTVFLDPTEVDLTRPYAGSGKWPFGSMLIGQCYSVSNAELHDQAICSYKYFAKKLGQKFKRKKFEDKLLIWRAE